MGRPLRLDPEHGIHHVYSRGTRRWTLFIDDLDYQRFIKRLGQVCVRYDVKIYAFCLMGNHFHLVAYCPRAQLSAALRDLKSVYARTHNDRHGFSGPLFESRFGSKLVKSYEYLRVLIRYVHRNPLAIDASASLASYRYSGHHLFLAGARMAPMWLDASFPLSFFDGISDYQRFVETDLQSDEVHARPTKHSTQRVLEPVSNVVSLSAILLQISTVAGCGAREVRPRMRNGLIGLLVIIASDVSGYTAAELADACGYSSPTAVYNAKLQTRRRLKEDTHLLAIHDTVIARLCA